MIAYGVFDTVIASRILGNQALEGGMPLYKYISNRFLTTAENYLIQQKLSEYHTGYRAFSAEVLENKLKFFPEIKEVVTFGDQRDFVTAFINIDLDAVGNWAERNNVTYASYQELAAHPKVYALVQECIEQVNQSLAQDSHLSSSQIRRFLILHKELDPDDGELTRTRKVRRRIINERYGDLIDALFDGREHCFVSTEVMFEDGRQGRIEADLEICDAAVSPERTRAAA